MKNKISIIWIFILGFIIGMMVNNMLYMYRLETLMDENEKISIKLEESIAKLNQLEKNNHKIEKPILNEIFPIHLNNDEMIIPINDIEQYIKVLLNNQIGKELNKIDINLIYNALNNRILKYDDGNYQLKIKTILSSDIMYIYYSVEKVQT